MLNLIVNADDFGLSEKVNEGIIIAFKDGILSSTSIMANGVAFDHALDAYEATERRLDIGVHLTLLEENPVADRIHIPSLLTADGRFKKNAMVFTKDYFLGRIKPAEIFWELDAQIRKIQDAGIPISHIDSHQHLHMLPGVYKIAVTLARKYNIPAIRVPYESPRWYMLQRKIMMPRLLQLLVLDSFCRYNSISGLVVPDCFIGFFHSGGLTYENVMTLFQKLPQKGFTELICHPGLDDPDSNYRHWNYRWGKELEALTHEDVKRYLAEKKITICSYRQMVERRAIIS